MASVHFDGTECTCDINTFGTSTVETSTDTDDNSSTVSTKHVTFVMDHTQENIEDLKRIKIIIKDDPDVIFSFLKKDINDIRDYINHPSPKKSIKNVESNRTMRELRDYTGIIEDCCNWIITNQHPNSNSTQIWGSKGVPLGRDTGDPVIEELYIFDSHRQCAPKIKYIYIPIIIICVMCFAIYKADYDLIKANDRNTRNLIPAMCYVTKIVYSPESKELLYGGKCTSQSSHGACTSREPYESYSPPKLFHKATSLQGYINYESRKTELNTNKTWDFTHLETRTKDSVLWMGMSYVQYEVDKINCTTTFVNSTEIIDPQYCPSSYNFTCQFDEKRNLVVKNKEDVLQNTTWDFIGSIVGILLIMTLSIIIMYRSLRIKFCDRVRKHERPYLIRDALMC